jgi:hypothetical protein
VQASGKTIEEDGIVLNRTLIAIQIPRRSDFHLFSLSDWRCACFHFLRLHLTIQFFISPWEPESWKKAESKGVTQTAENNTEQNCCQQKKAFEISANKWLFWKIVINLISGAIPASSSNPASAVGLVAALRMSNGWRLWFGIWKLLPPTRFTSFLWGFRGNLLTFEPFDIESFFKVTARAHARAHAENFTA